MYKHIHTDININTDLTGHNTYMYIYIQISTLTQIKQVAIHICTYTTLTTHNTMRKRYSVVIMNYNTQV